MYQVINHYWTVLIPILLYCISGAFDATMDTLKDHYSISIFKNKNPKFWNPQISWINKYNNGKVADGHRTIKLLFFTVNYPDTLTDSWHIFKLLREGANILSIISLWFFVPNTDTGLYLLAFMFFALPIFRNITFNIFYNKVLIA